MAGQSSTGRNGKEEPNGTQPTTTTPQKRDGHGTTPTGPNRTHQMRGEPNQTGLASDEAKRGREAKQGRPRGTNQPHERQRGRTNVAGQSSTGPNETKAHTGTKPTTSTARNRDGDGATRTGPNRTEQTDERKAERNTAAAHSTACTTHPNIMKVCELQLPNLY